MELCELVKVFILNATGTTLAVAQSAILIPPLEAGCALIGSQQSGFLLLFQPDLGHHAADRRAIDIEQFSNLSLTFRAQADHFDRLGLLGRGKLTAATTDSTVGASTCQTEFGSFLDVSRSGTLRLRSCSTNWSVQLHM